MPKPGQLRRIAIFVAETVAIIWIGVGVLAFFIQRPLLFPTPASHLTPNIRGANVVQIPLPSGGTAVALSLPAPEGGCTVVHFHGNSQQLADLNWLAWDFQRNRLGFFAVEYPGYGIAPGHPSEAGIDEAAEAALGYLRTTLHVPTERTVLEGWSLGSGAATEMARRGEGSRLILLAPFTSITDFGRQMFPFHPVSLLVRDPFDNAGKAPSISMPTLIVHGTEDQVIPVGMGQRLGTLFPHAATVLVPGAGHDLPSHNDVIDRIAAFARDCPGATVHPVPEAAPE